MEKRGWLHEYKFLWCGCYYALAEPGYTADPSRFLEDAWQRKSFTEIGKLYFWTATIHNWNCLLAATSFKNIIVDSLFHLSSKGVIDVFGFVIMPNHVHFIWRMNKMNGKEKPSGSFLKNTAHKFKKEIDPEMGFFALFIDTEGNKLGLHSMNLSSSTVFIPLK